MLGRQRLIVRRTRLVGAQAELWPDWRHFAFLTNRTDAIELVEQEHRSTPWELAIRDLKDQALAHFPSASSSRTPPGPCEQAGLTETLKRGFVPRERNSTFMPRARKYPQELIDRGIRFGVRVGSAIAHVAADLGCRRRR